jgi:hypothetical protein
MKPLLALLLLGLWVAPAGAQGPSPACKACGSDLTCLLKEKCLKVGPGGGVGLHPNQKVDSLGGGFHGKMPPLSDRIVVPSMLKPPQ